MLRGSRNARWQGEYVQTCTYRLPPGAARCRNGQRPSLSWLPDGTPPQSGQVVSSAASAVMAGAEERAIMAQTRHRSVMVARRSIRDGSLFRGNAAAAV